MNFLIDLHHSSLAYSFHLLLEKRLGHKIYFPIGLDWAEQGYWLIHKPYNFNPDTAKQYLQIKPEFIPMDGTQILNKLVKEYPTHYEVEDIASNYIRKHITLEQFKNMPIDVVIASVPDHYDSFNKLINDHKLYAKLICHFGNVLWNIQDFPYKNILASVAPQPTQGKNVCYYKQEFDLDLFTPSDLPAKKQIVSFINCLRETGHAKDYYSLKAELPEYEFYSFGGSCDDGVANTIEEISTIMKDSYFGFHCKFGGDGYGHILHNWMAVGKPVITRISDYRGKLGEKLLIDGETCFDLDSSNISDIAFVLRNLPPDKYDYMCQRAYEVFKENVNFEQDAKNVKKFLNNLQ